MKEKSFDGISERRLAPWRGDSGGSSTSVGDNKPEAVGWWLAVSGGGLSGLVLLVYEVILAG
jgi:hypothetical protein